MSSLQARCEPLCVAFVLHARRLEQHRTAIVGGIKQRRLVRWVFACAARVVGARQLRVLFTMLIGVFSALGALLTDLADPFRGAYRITPTAAQLFPLRQGLAQDVCSRSVDDSAPPRPPTTLVTPAPAPTVGRLAPPPLAVGVAPARRR